MGMRGAAFSAPTPINDDALSQLYNMHVTSNLQQTVDIHAHSHKKLCSRHALGTCIFSFALSFFPISQSAFFFVANRSCYRSSTS